MLNKYAKMHLAANKVPTDCHTPTQLYNIVWEGHVVRRNLEPDFVNLTVRRVVRTIKIHFKPIK